jgi:hypothetical protein
MRLRQKLRSAFNLCPLPLWASGDDSVPVPFLKRSKATDRSPSFKVDAHLDRRDERKRLTPNVFKPDAAREMP